jgi:gas vesicle protein
MRHDDMGTTRGIGSILVGFLIGGVIGAAAACSWPPNLERKLAPCYGTKAMR